ncbi:MAG: hypothetical protein KDD43_08430, partial [Bdellovibrionales bacterium]|nr:hypothetical protein [Bdellovibrionales bacterium]
VIGDAYMETYQLIVQMATNKKPVMSIVRKFPIFIQRDTVRPDIVKVHLPNEIQEGREIQFTVQVRDLDSTDGTLHRFREPHLTVVQTDDSARDGSHLVRLAPSTRDNPNPRRLDPADPTYDPNLWIYTLKVDARNKELTTSRESFKFGLIATSRFGLPSAEGGVPSKPKAVSVAVVSKTPKPLTTWPDVEIEFKANQETTFTWDLFSPLGGLTFRSSPEGDGDLEEPEILEKCSEELPGVAKCTCLKAEPWRYHCRMTWTPPTAEPGKEEFQIAFRVVNHGRFRPTDRETGEFLKTVKIVP